VAPISATLAGAKNGFKSMGADVLTTMTPEAMLMG
jgi:hypothetical protein